MAKHARFGHEIDALAAQSHNGYVDDAADGRKKQAHHAAQHNHRDEMRCVSRRLYQLFKARVGQDIQHQRKQDGRGEHQ